MAFATNAMDDLGTAARAEKPKSILHSLISVRYVKRNSAINAIHSVLPPARCQHVIDQTAIRSTVRRVPLQDAIIRVIMDHVRKHSAQKRVVMQAGNQSTLVVIARKQDVTIVCASASVHLKAATERIAGIVPTFKVKAMLIIVVNAKETVASTVPPNMCWKWETPKAEIYARGVHFCQY